MSVVTAKILSNSLLMNPEYNLISIDITKEINKIPIAQIIVLDGDASKQKFEISNTTFFQPGNKIEIRLRYEGKPQNELTVFEGIILKHFVKVNQNGSFLIIDLKDVAVQLTFERKSVVFRNITDKEIIDKIVKERGLKIGSISDTQFRHQEIVQYYCTDWDFIASRADINSQWLLVNDGIIDVIDVVKTGDITPKHIFKYGIDEIYELEMGVDISYQYEAIESTSWDIKNQENVPFKKAEKLSLRQGNLKADEMAKNIGAKKYKLITSGELKKEELQAWANGKMLKSRFSMLKGRLKKPGFADIKLGDVIKIDGVGDKFNGLTYVTGIRHQIDSQGWQTNIQFGLSHKFFVEKSNNIMENSASGIIPGIHNLQTGIISQYKSDPDKQFRVQVKIPSIESDGVVWARLLSTDAGKNRGFFFRPEPGDEVVVGFINNDPRQAIILGALYSQKNLPFEDFQVTEQNNKKGIITKGLLKLIFDDEKKSIQITTPNSNIIEMSDQNESIFLKDENNNVITMNKKGIKIKSDKDIIIEGVNINIKGSKVDVI